MKPEDKAASSKTRTLTPPALTNCINGKIEEVVEEEKEEEERNRRRKEKKNKKKRKKDKEEEEEGKRRRGRRRRSRNISSKTYNNDKKPPQARTKLKQTKTHDHFVENQERTRKRHTSKLIRERENKTQMQTE